MHIQKTQTGFKSMQNKKVLSNNKCVCMEKVFFRRVHSLIQFNSLGEVLVINWQTYTSYIIGLKLSEVDQCKAHSNGIQVCTRN